MAIASSRVWICASCQRAAPAPDAARAGAASSAAAFASCASRVRAGFGRQRAAPQFLRDDIQPAQDGRVVRYPLAAQPAGDQVLYPCRSVRAAVSTPLRCGSPACPAWAQFVRPGARGRPDRRRFAHGCRPGWIPPRANWSLPCTPSTSRGRARAAPAALHVAQRSQRVHRAAADRSLRRCPGAGAPHPNSAPARRRTASGRRHSRAARASRSTRASGG